MIQTSVGDGGFLGLTPAALHTVGLGITVASVAVLLMLAFLWGRVGRPRTELMATTAVALLLLVSGVYLTARGGTAQEAMMAEHMAMMGVGGMSMGGGMDAGGGMPMGGGMGGGAGMPMGSAAVTPVDGASSEALARFTDRQLYEVFCLNCHGEQGTGDGPVAPYLAIRPANIADHLTHHPEPDLIRILIEGFPPAMPASPIGESEATRILRYLRTIHPATGSAMSDEMEH